MGILSKIFRRKPKSKLLNMSRVGSRAGIRPMGSTLRGLENMIERERLAKEKKKKFWKELMVYVCPECGHLNMDDIQCQKCYYPDKQKTHVDG